MKRANKGEYIKSSRESDDNERAALNKRDPGVSLSCCLKNTSRAHSPNEYLVLISRFNLASIMPVPQFSHPIARTPLCSHGLPGVLELLLEDCRCRVSLYSVLVHSA